MWLTWWPSLERHGQRARTQARPPQGRVRIARRRRLDQGIQIPEQRRIEVDDALAAAARPPGPRAGERLSRRELTQAPLNGRRRDPCGARHLRNPAVADCLRFRGRPHPARSLRQHRRQGRMLRAQGGQIHGRTVPRADEQYKLLFPEALSHADRIPRGSFRRWLPRTVCRPPGRSWGR